MANLKLKTGSAADNDAYIGPNGEITADLTYNVLRLHDGVTPGGTIIGEPGDGTGVAVDGNDLTLGTTIQLLRGSTEAFESYVGEESELVADTTLKVLRLFDGGDPVSTGWIIGEIEEPAHPVVDYTPVFLTPDQDGLEIELETVLTLQDYIPATGTFYETVWTVSTDASFNENSIIYEHALNDTGLLTLDLENTPDLTLVEGLEYYVKAVFRAKNEANVSFNSIPAIRHFTLNSAPPEYIDYDPVFITPATDAQELDNNVVLEVEAYDGDVGNHHSTEWVFSTSAQFTPESILRSYFRTTPNHLTFDLESEIDFFLEEGLDYFVRVKYTLTNDTLTGLTNTNTTSRKFQITSSGDAHPIESYTPIFITPSADNVDLSRDYEITLEDFQTENGEHYATLWELSTASTFNSDNIVFKRHGAGFQLNGFFLNNGWASYSAEETYWLRVTYKATNAEGNRSYNSLPATRQFTVHSGSSANPIETYQPVFVNPYANGDLLDLNATIEVQPYSLGTGEHVITEWELAVTSEFGSENDRIYLRYGSNTELLSYRLDNGWDEDESAWTTIQGGMEYFVRVCFKVETDDGATTYTTEKTTLRFRTKVATDQSIIYRPTFITPSENGEVLNDESTVSIQEYDYPEGTHEITVWEVYSRQNNVGVESILFTQEATTAYTTSFNLDNGWGVFQEGVKYWVRVYFKALADDSPRHLISQSAECSFIYSTAASTFSQERPVFIVPEYDNKVVDQDTPLQLVEYAPPNPADTLSVVWKINDSPQYPYTDDEVADVVRDALNTIQSLEQSGTPSDELFYLDNGWDVFYPGVQNWAKVSFKSTPAVSGTQISSQSAERPFSIGQDVRQGIETYTPNFIMPSQNGQELTETNMIEVGAYGGSAHHETHWEVSLGQEVNRNMLVVDAVLSGEGLTKLDLLANTYEELSLDTTYAVRVTFGARSTDEMQTFKSHSVSRRFKINRDTDTGAGGVGSDYVPVISTPASNLATIEDTGSIVINSYTPSANHTIESIEVRLSHDGQQLGVTSLPNNQWSVPLEDLTTADLQYEGEYEVQVHFYMRDTEHDEYYNTQTASRYFTVVEPVSLIPLAENYVPIFVEPTNAGASLTDDHNFVLGGSTLSQFDHTKTHYDLAIDEEFNTIIFSTDVEGTEDTPPSSFLELNEVPYGMLRANDPYYVRVYFYFKLADGSDPNVYMSKSGVTNFVYTQESAGTVIAIPSDYPSLSWQWNNGNYSVSTQSIPVNIETTGLPEYDDLPPGYTLISTLWTVTPIDDPTTKTAIGDSKTFTVEAPFNLEVLELQHLDYDWVLDTQWYSVSVILTLYNSVNGSFYTRATSSVNTFTVIS